MTNKIIGKNINEMEKIYKFNLNILNKKRKHVVVDNVKTVMLTVTLTIFSLIGC